SEPISPLSSLATLSHKPVAGSSSFGRPLKLVAASSSSRPQALSPPQARRHLKLTSPPQARCRVELASLLQAHRCLKLASPLQAHCRSSSLALYHSSVSASARVFHQRLLHLSAYESAMNGRQKVEKKELLQLGAPEIVPDYLILSVDDLADQIAEVLNFFGLSAVMCMGVAVGAYILTLFAMKVLSASPLLVLSAKGYTGDKENLGKCEQVYFRAKVIFGLNALAVRTLQCGSAVGPWNSSNAESFICYTVRKNYSIAGWEFGKCMLPDCIYAKVASISVMNCAGVELEQIGIRHKPLIIAPGGFYDANWFQEFVNKSGKSVDVVSHHIYNLGAGVDEHLIERILDPSYLDGVASTFSGLKNILQKSATKAKAWVGEAGGAYNNGHHLVFDAFVYSFWYLDQLGMSTVMTPEHTADKVWLEETMDNLLKLTDTRASNNKMTLMHYLCKVLADRLPGLLDFHLDLVSLEAATK
ncbi:hypothetical protein S83_032062, partial [Arachis hypogaea]